VELAARKRPALFVEDTFDRKMMSGAWTLIAEKLGYEIALRVSMGLGGKDFTNAEAGNVDAILSLGNVQEAVTPVRQTKENKFNETTYSRPFHIQQT
jgi:hypothetical protein